MRLFYSGGVNMFAGSIALFFGLAVWYNRARFPRWTAYAALIAALLLLINAVGLFFGLPEIVIPHILFALFLVSATVGLTREAHQPAPEASVPAAGEAVQ